MTHYGFRILLENVNMSSLRNLDVSGKFIPFNYLLLILFSKSILEFISEKE